jgi:putative peptidoglycan lipid II flippase
LRKAGVYERRPGWGGYVVRLVLACVAMTVAVAAGLYWLPDFTQMADKWQRIGSLLMLVGIGVVAYAGSLLALGFRPRDLREH